MAQPGFDIPGLMEAAVEELRMRACVRALQGGDEGIPFGRDVGVGRQAVDVDQAFRLGQRLLVERRNPPRQGVDERDEFRCPAASG